jgi:hypothetical protein
VVSHLVADRLTHHPLPPWVEMDRDRANAVLGGLSLEELAANMVRIMQSAGLDMTPRARRRLDREAREWLGRSWGNANG